MYYLCSNSNVKFLNLPNSTHVSVTVALYINELDPFIVYCTIGSAIKMRNLED